MAYFRIRMHVNALRRQASFEMLIPNDIRTDVPAKEAAKPMSELKTLFLLHGYTAAPATGFPNRSPPSMALPS